MCLHAWDLMQLVYVMYVTRCMAFSPMRILVVLIPVVILVRYGSMMHPIK